ncbi:HSPB1-associated protein 1 homolog isoform X2 [Prorops nasuta]
MTMTEFIELNKCSNVDIKWYYFDYKHMNEWLKDKPEILSSLNWHMFGLDKKGEDSTIWIGNKGAHTNCHQDSYGCNLVAQIHGRKQWLLFPPNSNNEIKPIRVPYEESTIYSSYNFFCPTEDEETVLINKIENPRSVTLEAGDALLIPKGWWHYVESLDLSVSVNVWLPLETDNQERLKEALVKLIITGIEKTFCSESEDRQCTVPYCMKLIEATLDKCKYQYQNDTQEGLLKTNKKMKYSNERPTWKVQEITTEYMNYIKFIPILKIDEFKALLMEKRCRFSSVINEVKQGHSDSILVNKNISKKVINALCHPNIINQIAETLLNVTDRNK